MYLRPANYNQKAELMHRLRYVQAYSNKASAAEEQLKRPGSGKLWSNRLTSPKAPVLASQ